MAAWDRCAAVRERRSRRNGDDTCPRGPVASRKEINTWFVFGCCLSPQSRACEWRERLRAVQVPHVTRHQAQGGRVARCPRCIINRRFSRSYPSALKHGTIYRSSDNRPCGPAPTVGCCPRTTLPNSGRNHSASVNERSSLEPRTSNHRDCSQHASPGSEEQAVGPAGQAVLAAAGGIAGAANVTEPGGRRA